MSLKIVGEQEPRRCKPAEGDENGSLWRCPGGNVYMLAALIHSPDGYTWAFRCLNERLHRWGRMSFASITEAMNTAIEKGLEWIPPGTKLTFEVTQ